MTLDKTTIAVDLMGGDSSPYKTIKGAEIFSNQNEQVKLILLGEQKKIQEVFTSHNIKIHNYEIVNTIDNIQNDDSTNTILRKKNKAVYIKDFHWLKNCLLLDLSQQVIQLL